MVARFVMKSNKKQIISILAILTMAILLSCALVACTKADTGDRGTNGTNGQDGIDGKSAYQIWLDNGHTGTETDFLTWLKGKDGTNGLNGKDGTNGKDGKDGTNGTNGQDGIDGKSAYQIWLDNGNTGTEADFLTWLKGKDGTNGLNGKDGANGKDGKDGANGTNGQDGIDGKSAYQIWLDNGNTGTEADFLTWLKGKDGANGQDGANGKDGAGIQSATINNNGELIVTLDDGTIINAGQVVAPEKRLDENNQITFKTFEKTDKTIYGKVSNDTETFCFTDEIELKGGASYSVYTDFDCSNEIISKVVKLNVGDNTFYILEKCGNDSKFYTVTIRRREIYTVSFAVNDGTPLENSTIKIEEDRLVPKDSVPSSPRDGYDLVWDNDFTSPITENTVITATLTAIYSVSENTIAGLTDYGKSLTVLNIPSVIDGKSVTSIGNNAFYNCTGLTSVTIPDSVTSVGSDAFSGCAGLTSITIPDSVTSIGDEAFRDCNGLKSVTIPDSVTSIGAYAFYNTVWYNNQPDGLVYAGKVAYKYKGEMPNNTSIVLKEGTLGIGDSAFSGCKGLTSITIPDSVTSIGNNAFYNCTGLTSVTIPNSVTSIGYRAFYNCSSLTSITIPDSVTSIGNYAFEYCSALTSVTLGNSVTSIGKDAFKNCYKLVEVYNKSALSITAGSSDNGGVARYAKNVYTNEGGSKLTTDENGYVIYMDEYEMILVSYRGTNIELVLPSYITKINQNAFSGCSSLTSITIPDSVTSIGDSAFSFCTGLTSITIGESVTSIGGGAFSGCKGLTSITIPNSVTSIGAYAFSFFTGLTSIIVDEGNTKYHSAGNCLIETESKTLIAGCKNSIIPTDGSVTSIGSSAFRGCTGLTSITIPNSVTSIGEDAFYGCTGLTNITIPDSVTSIGRYAFMNCTGLTNITIPDSVTSIGDRAFYDTTWYNNQPDGLVYAGKVAYKYKGTMPSNTSIVLKEGTLGITDYAFEGCCGLTSVTIPNSVTSIGYEAFYNCSSLTSMTIPDNVTSIGDFAFGNCTGLTSIAFNGTIAQWSAISKGYHWKNNVPATEVVCKDGKVSI